jgi:uncharacterized protein
MVPIDYKILWAAVTAQFPLGVKSIHGPAHWKQVEENGLLLAEQTGADKTIIRLFAVFHDSRRQNEGIDNGHGSRGAELAIEMRGMYFDLLTDDSFETLLYACRNHTSTKKAPDDTIGTCWDADRLDLPRVFIQPDPRRMQTAYGRQLVTDMNALKE